MRQERRALPHLTLARNVYVGGLNVVAALRLLLNDCESSGY